MKIILPYHNNISEKVKSWRQIKEVAEELRAYIRAGKFEGYYDNAYAIAHMQVEEKDPKTFFVLNEDMSDSEAGKGFLKDIFGHWCVINPSIIKFSEPCSFKEGCMSFPLLKPRNKNRMYEITVIYYIPKWGILWRKKKKLEGIYAFIMQHELEHLSGTNMYGRIRGFKK